MGKVKPPGVNSVPAGTTAGAQASPMAEFWHFAQDFHDVYARVAKIAVAAPILDLVIAIGSPWPSRVSVCFLFVLVQTLIIMCSFAFWRQGRATVYGIKSWLLWSTTGFLFFFLLAYLPLFSFFVVPAPSGWNAVVRGYTLRSPIEQFVTEREAVGEAWEAKALIAHFVDNTHDETSIWTPESVFTMRSIVLGTWLLVGVLYALAVSAFIALQYRRIR